MAQKGYERLSAQDSSFVIFEGPRTHVHVCATARFEPGSLVRPEKGLDMDRIRAHIGARLHLLPRYRQRLAFTPIEGHPVWVDDERFDLAYHVRHAGLPAPGEDAQLKELAGRIASQPLDRGRPLWELWFAEGLAGGGFAVVAKVHHCMVDGVSGVNILTSLLSATPDERVEPATPWTPRPAPATLDYLADGVAGAAALSASAVRALGGALSHPGATLSDLARTARAGLGTLGFGLSPPPPTPLNRAIGSQRRVDWRALDLGALRDLKKRLDGSVNDVMLTIVAGAVRRFLKARRIRLSDLEYRIVVPVDTRRGGEESVANRVSAWFLSIPMRERDPLRRFAQIRQQTRRRKSTDAEAGIDRFLRFADWSGASPLTALGVGLVSRLRPYNLIVSNVHGPQFPLYLLDAPLTAFYPMLPLFENQGLAVAAMSYLGQVGFGISADWDLVPDLPRFSEAIAESFAELSAAAER